jgi:microcompartment protein CcmK/EutM
MRIGKVVGRVTLTQSYETLVGGRFLIVEVQDRFALSGQSRQTTEVLVVYDHFGAQGGDLIGVAEMHGAATPFYPEKRVPLDAYNACILDVVVVSHELKGVIK